MMFILLNEQTIQPTDDNELIFYSSQPIRKKIKDTNKKNTSELQRILKKKKKKKKKKYKTHESLSNKLCKTLKTINDSVDYVTVPDEIISQISSTAFSETDKLFWFLYDDEKITLIHYYTSLIDRLSYVKLQEFQWKNYHDTGMTQNIWRDRISKHLAEKYSIFYTYGRSKILIEQRLKQIEKHLRQAHNAIERFEEEITGGSKVLAQNVQTKKDI